MDEGAGRVVSVARDRIVRTPGAMAGIGIVARKRIVRSDLIVALGRTVRGDCGVCCGWVVSRDWEVRRRLRRQQNWGTGGCHANLIDRNVADLGRVVAAEFDAE